jgi:DNA repair and recombination protein RAD52
MDWDRATAELNKPLDRSNVSDRQQAGRKLSYIEGWHAIAEANRIFGHDGWHRESELTQLGEPYTNAKGNWVVNYMGKCRITISNEGIGVLREGCGFGSGIDADLGRAHESAIKEAETDATKRALMTFGWPFGLALYDKTQEHVSDGNGLSHSPQGALHASGVSGGNGSKYGPGEFSSGKSDVSAAKSKTHGPS